MSEKIKNIFIKIRIAYTSKKWLKWVSIALVGVLVCVIVFSAGKEKKAKTDVGLIEQRIETFVEDYNDGDFKAVLASMEKSTRIQMEAMFNLMGGVLGNLTGIDFDLSSMFGLGVAVMGEKLYIEIGTIDFTSKTTAIVDSELGFKSAKESSGTGMNIYMEKEDGDWYIQNIVAQKEDDHSSSNNGNNSTANGGSVDSGYDSIEDSSTQNTPSLIRIDPFAGIKIVASGISPYCELGINNADCSYDAQAYVEYSFDKEKYKNGDTAVITAKLIRSAQEKYTLTATQYRYVLSGQPEYITSVENVDFTLLKSELEDAIAAEIGESLSSYGYFFGSSFYQQYKSIELTAADTYFSTLKFNKIDTYDGYFNRLSFTYKVDWVDKYDRTGTYYTSITAVNIVQYPDGTLLWGTKNLYDLNFIMKSTERSHENCVATLIMVHRDDYNISQVEIN